MTQGSGGWRYVCASVPGVAHLADGIERQDACATRLLPAATDADSILALAIADGAGSAAESRAGAELACQTLLDECAAGLSQTPVADWTPALAETLLQRVQAALTHHAAAEGLPVRELACTLLGALLAADRALFLQIGDGAIVIGSEEGYRPVFWPQGGEYTNETHFVTDPNAAAWLECAILSETVAEVALLTDGLQWLALRYHSRQAHNPFFRPLFERLRDYPATGDPAELPAALERFLSSPAINQRTHDDKTLILAVRLPAENAGPPPVPAATEIAAPTLVVDPGASATAAIARPDPAESDLREKPCDEAV